MKGAPLTKQNIQRKLMFISFPKRNSGTTQKLPLWIKNTIELKYEGWNFNSGNYLFKTDTK